MFVIVEAIKIQMFHNDDDDDETKRIQLYL